ncbi:hypothetical protein P7K49_004411, partial [Saguinus oedipus]
MFLPSDPALSSPLFASMTWLWPSGLHSLWPHPWTSLPSLASALSAPPSSKGGLQPCDPPTWDKCLSQWPSPGPVEISLPGIRSSKKTWDDPVARDYHQCS